MRPVTIDPKNPTAALIEIQRASHEGDLVELAQNFTFDTPPTQTLQLLVGTPTLANTNAIVATLLKMMQQGGINRTT